MNISLSQADTLTCPACNASFEATIWLIIAANEHPDLIERIRTGTLHTVTCPHCDHTGSLDAPLLIFRPDAEPPILFSPAQQTSREQDQQHAAELVAQLRERLGSAWREAWLAQGVPGVARALLPVALANDPEAGLRDRRERDPATFAQLEAAARQAMEASGEAVVPPAMAMPATVQPLIDRINQLNRIAEIPQRVELCRQALTLVTKATNPQLWAKLHFELGNSLYQNRLGDRAANLEQAIEAYQQALTVFTQDALPIDWANTLHNLAAAHQARIWGDRAANLEQAIAAYQQALTVFTQDATPIEWAQTLTNLATAYQARIRGDRAANLEQAISLFQQAVDATPPNSPALPTRLSNLGMGLHERFNRTGRFDDLEQAISLFQQAVDATPPNSPALPTRLSNLGMGLHERFNRTSRFDDLERAISFYQQAIDATPPDSPDRPYCLNYLGAGLQKRYAHTGQLDDLEQAISALQQALTATTPNHDIRPSILTHLGNALSARYTHTGQNDDLDQAISAFQQALDAIPSNAPDRPQMLNNLGNGLSKRYDRTGQLDDLEQAISAFQQAVAATSPDSPNRPIFLSNLGNGLSRRYNRTGKFDDLEQAISALQQAVDATPVGAPDRPKYITSLGNELQARYKQTGRLDDLEQAISAFRQAIDSTPPSSIDLPLFLSNLGNGLIDRYTNTKRIKDLKDALDVYRSAVAATPPNSSERPSRLNNLGKGLRTLYNLTKRLEDLERAISAFQQAVDSTPPDSPDLPMFLANLGNGLLVRYTHIERQEDLEQAISTFQRAVDSTSPDSPSLPRFLSNLGNGLSKRYNRTKQPCDLAQARTCYSRAYEHGKLIAPNIALLTSQLWGDWACEHAEWADAVEAFERGLVTLEQLHRTQARRGDQEIWLSNAFSLHARAAYAVVRAAAPGAVRRAVEVAELGRARGLGETLARDRADLALIERDHPDLFARYCAAAEAVRALERADRANSLHDLADEPAAARFTDLMARIRAARAELDEAIAAIRAVPGAEGFLQPPAYANIAATARPGAPLVYLITTPHGSLALIVPHAAEPEALLLDEFTEANLYTLLIERADDKVIGGYLHGQLLGGTALTTALARGLPHLGAVLIAPLAARLRALSVTGVTLIPAGLLGLLPLHAATYPVDGQPRCLLDEFDVAYAPSARVLATAQRELQRRAPQALRLAGVGNPTGNLRYAGAELASICDLLPPGASTPLYAQAATRDALWQVLQSSTMAHFACHGQFDQADPLDSALLLAGDSRLTLRELLTGDTTALAHVRLAVLSACQTAVTDFQNLPDESIGLPGGFLQAGVPAVAGSLWSVNDLSTALLMHRFYELHLHGDPDAGLAPQPPARALRLAQLWLRDLSYGAMLAYFERHRQLRAAQQLPAAPAARMPLDFIATGRALAEEGALDDPAYRPYADPVYWAAFTFNGALEGVG